MSDEMTKRMKEAIPELTSCPQMTRWLEREVDTLNYISETDNWNMDEAKFQQWKEQVKSSPDVRLSNTTLDTKTRFSDIYIEDSPFIDEGKVNAPNVSRAGPDEILGIINSSHDYRNQSSFYQWSAHTLHQVNVDLLTSYIPSRSDAQDMEISLALVEKVPCAGKIFDHIADNPEFVLKAVEHDERHYDYMSYDAKIEAGPDFAIECLEINPKIDFPDTDDFLVRRELALEYISQRESNKNSWNCLPFEFHEDRDFCIQVVKNNPEAYSLMNEEFKADKDFYLEVSAHHLANSERFTPRIQNNNSHEITYEKPFREFTHSNDYLLNLDISLRCDKDVLLMETSINPACLKHTSTPLRNDIEVVANAHLTGERLTKDPLHPQNQVCMNLKPYEFNCYGQATGTAEKNFLFTTYTDKSVAHIDSVNDYGLIEMCIGAKLEATIKQSGADFDTYCKKWRFKEKLSADLLQDIDDDEPYTYEYDEEPSQEVEASPTRPVDEETPPSDGKVHSMEQVQARMKESFARRMGTTQKL